MPLPSPEALSKLFEGRISEVRSALEKGASGRATKLSEANNLQAFGLDTNGVFDQVVGIKSGLVGSWIRGVPLPAMLAAKRRLTVDVTPATLVDFGASYNLSPSAFIAFAEAGLFLINVRDYDPQNPNAQRALEAYASADKTGFLPQLFEKASKHIYFLATLRDDLFNPLFSARGSLRGSFEQASNLEGAAKAAADLSFYSDLIRKAVFRNERPDLIAVRWHWAYAQATQRFSKQIDPDIFKNIAKEFDAIVKDTSADKAADYLDLAVRLRYAHLLTSAPVSASFGGVYNLLLDGEAEFLQAVRFGGRFADYDFVQDDLLDTIRSLQLGRLPADIEKKIPVRYRSTLTSAGIEVFVRYNDTSYLKHYENTDHQKQLIAYVLEEDGQEPKAAKLQSDIDAVLAQQFPDPRAVAYLAAESGGVAMVRGQRLKRLTELHQGIELPTTNLLSLPSTPIYQANPKLANLLLKTARITENRASIGGAEDVQRRTYWFPRIFRRPPH